MRTTWTRAFAVAAGLATALAGAAVRPAAAAQYHPIIPCRIVDTRLPAYGPAIAGTTARAFTVRGSGLGIGDGHSCSVPTTAKAVALHVTAVPNGDAGLFMVVDAARTMTLGEVSTLNWEAGTSAIANAAVVPLGTGTASHKVKVHAGYHPASTAHVVIDVAGWFQ